MTIYRTIAIENSEIQSTQNTPEMDRYIAETKLINAKAETISTLSKEIKYTMIHIRKYSSTTSQDYLFSTLVQPMLDTLKELECEQTNKEKE